MYIEEKEMCPAYISKHNSTHEKPIILLIIPNKGKEGRWHYLHYYIEQLQNVRVVFTAWIVFILLEQKTQMSWRSMYNKDFCGTVMPSKKDKMVEFSQYIKSDKMPYTIYADIESLISKIDGCTNNPKNSSTTKIGEYIPCG